MILFLVLLLCSTSAYAMDAMEEIVVEGTLVVEGANPDGWSNASANSLAPNEIGPHKKCYNFIKFKFVPNHDGDPYQFELPLADATALKKGTKWQRKTTTRKRIILQKAVVGRALVSKIQAYAHEIKHPVE